MISFEEAGVILDELADELPEEFYRELNGGIILVPEAKPHSSGGNLYILGEYHNDRTGYGGLGRYIAVYYGSFVKLYANMGAEYQKEQLRKTLIHEFTHHIESLAGDRSLEKKDAETMERYKKRYIRK
ncbi:MAG: metallopeptidase family protein [Oscillospiraceae bacterium]|nr:metallopeptidase family protein [Oscillospiraceae bacterium]